MSDDPHGAPSQPTSAKPKGVGVIKNVARIGVLVALLLTILLAVGTCHNGQVARAQHDKQVADAALKKAGISSTSSTTTNQAETSPQVVQNGVQINASANGLLHTPVLSAKAPTPTDTDQINCKPGRTWPLQPKGQSGDTLYIRILDPVTNKSRKVDHYSPSALDGKISMCSGNDPSLCITKDNQDPVAAMDFVVAKNLTTEVLNFSCSYDESTQ